MPPLKGAPLKRPAFEGDSWKAVAADAKQMRLTPVSGLAMAHDSLPAMPRRPPVPSPQTVPQSNGDRAGLVDAIIGIMPDAPVIHLVPVVKLDLRLIFHGAAPAVACSLYITKVNPAVAVVPALDSGRRFEVPKNPFVSL